MKQLRLFKTMLLMCLLLSGISNAWGEGRYVKVTSEPSDWRGDYLIVYEEGNVAFNGSLETLDAVSNTKPVTIVDGVITATEEMNAIKFTVDYKTGSTAVYSLKSASGYYVSGTKAGNQATNGIVSATNDDDYEISFEMYEGNVVVHSKSSNQEMSLRYNKTSGQNRFRFYKSGQEPISFYKYEEVGGSTPTNYSINIDSNIANGTVTTSTESATAGTEITLTATPADGYKFGSWNVTNATTSATITVTDNKFTMPSADVNVSASFIAKKVLTLSEMAESMPEIENEFYDEVNVTRSITLGNWSSLCVPFDMDLAMITDNFGQDVRLLELTGLTTVEGVTTLMFSDSKPKYIHRGTPYIIKVPVGLTKNGEPVEKIEKIIAKNVFVNTIDPINMVKVWNTDNSNYAIYHGNFSREIINTTSEEGNHYFLFQSNQVKIIAAQKNNYGFRGHFEFPGTVLNAGFDEDPIKYSVAVSPGSSAGSVFASSTQASKGETVTLTATPAVGYEFVAWNVTYAPTGESIEVTNNTFTMPAANVNVSAEFREVQESAKVLNFDFVTHPSGWPVTKANAAEGSYTYTLESESYEFTHSHVGDGIYLSGTSGTSGYLLMAAGNMLGLPVVEGYRLAKVVGQLNNSGSPSTSSKVSITDGANIVSGGEEQTWSTKGERYTYELTGAWANKNYYLSVSNRNCQMITLSLTYEKAGAGDIATHTLESISVKNEPSMTEYYVDDTFNPAGLVITAKYDDGTEEIEYFGNEDKFTFDPDIETSLTTSNTSVTITFGGKTVNLPIVVEEKTIANTKETAYTVPQAIALIDAGKGLSTPVYVKGFVTSIAVDYDPTYGNISFNISETGSTSAPKFQFFRNQETATTTYSEAPDITKGDYVIGFGYLTKYHSTYEYKAGNYLVEHVKPESALTNITLQGTDNIVFTIGDQFNHNGVTVIANYENGTTKDVTNEAEFSTPDMNTVGKKTVTVSYKSASATYTIDVNAADIPEGAIVVTYNFHEKSDYPQGFPTATGTSAPEATNFVISGNDIILQAPDAYYIINNNAPGNIGLIIGKSQLNNGTFEPTTAYIGFPAKPSCKLIKVVATTTATTAGIDLNIYDTDFVAVSSQVSITSQTKSTYVFNISDSSPNTEYRLATSSKGKNMQFDNIVLVYENAGTDPDTPVDPEPTGVKYVLVEDEADLTDGEYVITAESENGTYKAMTSTIDQGYINETSVNVVDKTISVLNGAAVWNVTCGVDEYANPYINIMYNDKYLSNNNGDFAFTSTPDYFYCFIEEGIVYTSDWDWWGHTDGFMISRNDPNMAIIRFFKKVEDITVSVTTNSLGWATYAPSYNVELPEQSDDVRILYVQYKDVTAPEGNETGVLTTSDAYDVIEPGEAIAAGTGILVKTTEPNTEVTFKVSTTVDVYDSDIMDNCLVGVIAEEGEPYDSTHDDRYLFTKKNGVIGFYRWTSGTLAKNKCYLQLPQGASSKVLFFELSDDTTGLEDLLLGSEDGDMYNIAGQRVRESYHGVIIKNGRKFINK